MHVDLLGARVHVDLLGARMHVDLLGAVIKPIYGAASIGVVRVNDMPQLEQAYKRVTRELAKAHIVAGALQQGEEDEEDEDGAADQAIDATVSQVSLHLLTPMHAVSKHTFSSFQPQNIYLNSDTSSLQRKYKLRKGWGL